MPVRTKKPLKKSESTIRIIAGQWRGRKLPVLDENGLRPTGDRLRETLFNWLMPYLHHARVWDLYAGTGALGLEALSRGAQSAVFIEYNSAVAQQLQNNLKLLNAQSSKTAIVINNDCRQWLKQQSIQPLNANGALSNKKDTPTGKNIRIDESSRTDIVFVDPPFANNLWQSTIDHLEHHPSLSHTALIYIEKRKNDSCSPPPNWQLLKSKQTGSICAQLFQRMKNETN